MNRATPDIFEIIDGQNDAFQMNFGWGLPRIAELDAVRGYDMGQRRFVIMGTGPVGFLGNAGRRHLIHDAVQALMQEDGRD